VPRAAAGLLDDAASLHWWRHICAHQEEVGALKKGYVKPELRKVGLLRDVTKTAYSVCELK